MAPRAVVGNGAIWVKCWWELIIIVTLSWCPSYPSVGYEVILILNARKCYCHLVQVLKHFSMLFDMPSIERWHLCPPWNGRPLWLFLELTLCDFWAQVSKGHVVSAWVSPGAPELGVGKPKLHTEATRRCSADSLRWNLSQQWKLTRRMRKQFSPQGQTHPLHCLRTSTWAGLVRAAWLGPLTPEPWKIGMKSLLL